MSPATRVVVLGGYGHFGVIAARRLVLEPGFEVVIAGRNAGRAGEAASALGCEAACVDRDDPLLAARLRGLGARLVIDVAGPFQGRDYAVPRAAACAGAHCVDIADARPYVMGIDSLACEAKAHGVALVSGASSVPALTSAVVEHLARGLGTIDRIDMGISTSGRLPEPATADAVLSYCGEPIPAWRDSGAASARGWAALRRRKIPGLGARWFVDADVPDMELLPTRYPGLRELRFGAGSESRVLMGITWFWSKARASHLVPVVRHVPGAAYRAWRRWAPSSGCSALFVEVEGRDAEGAPRRRGWTLVASGEDGAGIPVLPAVAMARKLASGRTPGGSATPCIGLLSLLEIRAEMEGLRVQIHENEET